MHATGAAVDITQVKGNGAKGKGKNKSKHDGKNGKKPGFDVKGKSTQDAQNERGKPSYGASQQFQGVWVLHALGTQAG